MLLRRAPVTVALLIAIGIGYVLQLVFGDGLTALGANYGPAIRAGQYWRLVTSMFLHGGLLHLALNAWALYQLGALFELLVGSPRMLLVYFVTGIAGSLVSAWFSPGAERRRLGGDLRAARRADRLPPAPPRRPHAAGEVDPDAARLLGGDQRLLRLLDPEIDNSAHLGGCAAGLLLGFTLPERRQLALAPDRTTAGLSGTSDGGNTEAGWNGLLQ